MIDGVVDGAIAACSGSYGYDAVNWNTSRGAAAAGSICILSDLLTHRCCAATAASHWTNYSHS